MELLSPHLGLLFWTLLAFLTTFFILAKFAWKPIVKAIQQREKKIEEAIHNTKVLEAKLESLKSENDAMMEKVRGEKAQLLKEAQEQAKEIIEKSRIEAKDLKENMLQQTQEDLEALKAKTFSEIKSEVTELVFKATEAILSEKLQDKKRDEQIILESLKSFTLN